MPDALMTSPQIIAEPAIQFASSSQLTIWEVDPLQDSRWDAFIAKHTAASVFHSREWLTALHRTYKYKALALTTAGPERPLSDLVLLCEVNSWLTGRRLVSLPFSDHCDPLISSQQTLDSLLLHARDRFNRGDDEYVEIRPRKSKPGVGTGFAPQVTYLLHRLDLSKNASELFKNFHKDCVQRKIRRAEREKLRYEEGSSEQLLKDFYRLMVMTRRRQFLAPQPLAWFRGLIGSFGSELKIRVAYKDACPVASILTLAYKKTLTYKYGCSDARFNNLGGTQLLFWSAILQAKEQGFEELDMGRSDRVNPGLIAFKEHWGAVGNPITYWTCPPRSESLPRWLRKEGIRKLISVAPDVALQAAGTLLYRHIG